jgi:hypothetical protein
LGPGHSVLSFSFSRFLTSESLLGKLSETVVLQGNAPHDRPRSLVSHLIDNRASFLCTKAHANARLRGNARGRDGGVREVMATRVTKKARLFKVTSVIATGV